MKHNTTYHTVPRETFQAIDELILEHEEPIRAYSDALMWWNRRINLVSRDVSRETISQHIRHSLLLTQLNVFKESEFIVDAGTGGGLPGIPLAITSSFKKFLLNDIVSKKVLAVKDISRKLKLSNIETADKSIGEVEYGDSFLLISKHAFKIDDLYHLTSHLPWSTMVFYKGESFNEELQKMDVSLNISVYDLFEHSYNDFYKGKSIIVISR